MSKYLNRANELLSRVQSLKGKYEKKEKSTELNLEPEYSAPAEVGNQFPELLLDTLNLLHADSPELPLFIQANRMSNRIDPIYTELYSKYTRKDFDNLEKVLLKYIEYRVFLEEKD